MFSSPLYFIFVVVMMHFTQEHSVEQTFLVILRLCKQAAFLWHIGCHRFYDLFDSPFVASIVIKAFSLFFFLFVPHFSKKYISVDALFSNVDMIA